MAAKSCGNMNADMICFADTLRTLPSVEHITRLELYASDGQLLDTIENRPGCAGSVAVYSTVTRADGWLDDAAAAHALTLYAEHCADARAYPGKHPNIDRLLALIANGQRVRVVSISR